MGPLGRLEHLVDGQVTNYQPQYGGATGVTPAKIEVEQRDAFVSLPSTSRSVVDATSSSPPWTPPELLGSIGTQLVSVCDAQPRVFTGADWRTYPGVRVLGNILSQSVLHTSQKALQVPDSAWLSGVTCAVWTESTTTSTGTLTTSFVSLKDDDGTWLVTPSPLLSGSTIGAFARVVTDGVHFFVFWKSDATHVDINCYDTHGALLAQSGIAVASSKPGAWDVVASPTPAPNAGTVLFASVVSTIADSGVQFVSVGFASGSIVTHFNTDTSVLGSLALSWITNDVNALAYLATYDSTNTIWAYEISALAQVHQFGSISSIATDHFSLDTIAGYVIDAGSGGFQVVLSIGLLPSPISPPAHGPPVDPALRFIASYGCSRSNTVVVLRSTNSFCQVSRAFAVDGEYYVFAYYQSGSGLGLLPKTQSVSITDGDFMIGAASQPLAVSTGDLTFGSPVTQNVPARGGGAFVIDKTGTIGATAMGASSVSLYTINNASSAGIPDGTVVLKWTLSGLTVPTGGSTGSRLIISGSSALNGSYDILDDGNDSPRMNTNQILTPTQNIIGTNVSPATLTGGTWGIASMTSYFVNDLSVPVYNTDSAALFIAGTIVITNSSGSGNNGTWPIARIRSPLGGFPSVSGMNPSYGLNNGAGESIVWVETTGQSSNSGSFTAVISEVQPNVWTFRSGEFDSTYIGADLVVSANPAQPTNVGTFPITAVPGNLSLTTGGATSLIPQFFTFPFPTISIDLTTQQPYTFKLQSLGVPDYTFQGALVSVQGADPTNNGVYQIVQINADGTFIATPANGLTNQVNEAFFAAGPVVVTIFFAQNIQPEFQPTWFIVPLTGSQPVVGRFEYALAYADWRIEIDDTHGPNLYPMSLSSPGMTSLGWQTVLPYRAQNVTAATLEQTSAGQVSIVEESFDSTVGLKAFLLENEHGRTSSANGELSLPGPMSVVFTASGFLEDGQNLAPEAPFLIAQSVSSSGQLGLTLGGIYFITAVLEFTDDNGNRTYSPPSPALQVNMSGTNNVATYGGRLPYPLSSTGGPVANAYGPTTRLSGISLYRTAFLNGEPTTQAFKITDDLNVNGLAPISTVNPSGFAFPNSFTWEYTDQNADAGLNANEILYTNKSLLPRFPAPAGRGGLVNWKNREWAIGYDDAIWMSGEKTEGDAIWFNPAFRFPFPSEDAPLAISGMDDYLIVICEASVWYIPAAQFPDATGGNGGLPTPVRLPFPNGSRNGFALTIREGVAYDSTDGGVWLVSRQLENKWISHDLLETLTGEVVGMAIDQGQRLFVLQANSLTLCVYDGIPQCWYEWKMPTQGLLLAAFNGQAVYQDAAVVVPVVPGATADVVNGVTTGIAGPDVTVADMIFANVRGLKKVWEFQAVGTYKGPHNANVVLSYPEDGWPTKTYGITPSPTQPYVLPFNPNPEDASTYKVRIFPDFSGIVSPGATFSLEVLSAQVGVEPTGLNKLPAFLVMKAK